MADIYLSLGSNIDRERHIVAALDSLDREFGPLVLSSVYESEAVGFEGDTFFNLVVGIRSALSVSELSKKLKNIELANGRDHSAPRFSSRSLDIDILTVDNLVGEYSGVQLPRDEVLKNAFVLLPLQEIAPDVCHPVSGQSYSQHWGEYDREKQKLWPIEFIWRGKHLTKNREKNDQ